MKVIVIGLGLLIAATQPVFAQGSSPMSEEEALVLVKQLEEGSRPGYEAVSVLVDDGRTVEDATALVVRAGSPDSRAYVTLFGMCLAGRNGEFAGEVGNAVQAVAAEDDAAVLNTISNFSFDQCEQFNELLQSPMGAPDPRGPGPEPVPPVSPAD